MQMASVTVYWAWFKTKFVGIYKYNSYVPVLIFTQYPAACFKGRFFFLEGNQPLVSSSAVFNLFFKFRPYLTENTLSLVSVSARTIQSTQLLSTASLNHGYRSLTSLVIMANRVLLSDSFHQHADRDIIQGVSGGIVDTLGDDSMDCSEYISSYKFVSNFQWVCSYSCFNLVRTELSPLDFCLWGYIKSEVYKEKVNTRDRLVVHKARTPRRPQESYAYYCHESWKVHWSRWWDFWTLTLNCCNLLRSFT
jgi:hypothetical protein